MNLFLLLLHHGLVSGAHGPLMVTKDSDFLVGEVICGIFFMHRALIHNLVQLLLHSPRRVIGTEHFGRKSRHIVLKMLV